MPRPNTRCSNATPRRAPTTRRATDGRITILVSHRFCTVRMADLIVVSGATVRLTASGLGCEHWPGCTAGNPFPSKSYHSFIEFGNRVVSARDDSRDARRLGRRALHARRSARAPQARTRHVHWDARQAPLGAITVYSGLNPWLVMSHFMLALVVLAGGVVLAVEAISFERGRSSDSSAAGSSGAARWSRRRRCSRSSSPGRLHGRRAAPGQRRRRGLVAPARRALRARTCDRDLRRALPRVPRLHLSQPRTVAAVRRRRRHRCSFVLLVQMGVGELQYRTHLPWWLVLVHVALAAAVWACAIALVAVIERPPKAFAPTLPRWPRS